MSLISTATSWETIIGLEIHIQLNTLSKAFCGDAAAFSTIPNSQTSVISLAHPGSLPKLNQKLIESAARLGLAMNCKINPRSYFERKQYFYPDLPKGYQLSQQEQAICLGGHLMIKTADTLKKIRLHHIHMEEDAGKSVHDTDPFWSKIDLNRAGVPLLEMVTEPDFRTAEEVSIFLTELQRIVRYLDISDANMEEGSMRCDINLSIRPNGTEELRERCEIKNVNSRRFARRAIEYEMSRQVKLWENGETVIRQTMQFVPEEGVTVPVRQKESAHDYRYMPDPDLPPVLINQSQIDHYQKSLPKLPMVLAAELVDHYGLSAADAFLLTEEIGFYKYFIKLVGKESELYKTTANWLVQNIIPYIRQENLDIQQFPIKTDKIKLLVASLVASKLNTKKAGEIWLKLLADPDLDLSNQLNAMGSSATDDELDLAIESLFSKFPSEAKDFRQGKKKLIGFFMGEIMKINSDFNPKTIQIKLNEKGQK